MASWSKRDDADARTQRLLFTSRSACSLSKALTSKPNTLGREASKRMHAGACNRTSCPQCGPRWAKKLLHAQAQNLECVTDTATFITLLWPVLPIRRSSREDLRQFHAAVRTIVDAVDDGDFGEALHVVAVVEFACLNGSQIRPHAHLTFIPGTVARAPQASAIMTYWRRQLDGELPKSKAVRFHGTISAALRYLAKGPRGKSTTEKNWNLAARHLLDPFEDDVGQRAALYLRTARVTPWELQCIRARAREATVERVPAGKRWRHRSADKAAAKQVPKNLRQSTRHAPRCPTCKSTHLKKNGKTNAGTQRFKCRTCGKTFSDRAIMARREKAAKEQRLACEIYRLREWREWTWQKIRKSRGIGHPTAKRLYEQHRARHYEH